MSWIQGGQAAPPAPEPDPAGGQRQPYSNQQSMYPNYQDNVTSAVQHPQQQQYWQMQQQPLQYNQQYGQVYQQQQQLQQPQEYAANNANQMYPPQQYNHNYSNPTYNTTQAGYPAQQQQQNYYPNQPTQQNFAQGKKKDGWEDNWDWGWEDPTKQMKNAANIQQSITAPNTVPNQQPAFNNANVIDESFVATNTWNWNTEDKNQTNLGHTNVAPAQETRPPAAVLPTEAHAPEHVSNEHPKRNTSNMSAQSTADEVRTLNDKEIVKERLPNLALGKRLHLENLTPQWSIESQMSQESSDGIQTHSESTYLSENQSRNSNSSPALNADQYNSHSMEESPQNTEWSRHSVDESTVSDNTMRNMLPEDPTEVTNSLRDMSISNREDPRRDSVLSRDSALSRDSRLSNHDDVLQENGMPPVIQPPFSQPPPFLPPPPMSAVLPPPPQASNLSAVLPPPPQSSNLSSGTNPFKNAGGFSHKATSVLPPPSQFPPVPKEMQSHPSANLTSPAAVNMVQLGRSPMGFSANLETTPDNSERPDQPQVSTYRPVSSSQQVPDNLEVAPRNDRNEYLQTAHLSSGDYGENTDFSRSAPPPGFRRMVVGQQESEYNQNMSGDEPPPGLSRMVPGQQTESDGYNQGDSYSPGDSYMDRHADGGPTDGGGRPYRQADGQQTPDSFTQAPNRGTFRMVPGESNGEFAQYPSSFGNEQRVVTGLDFEYGAAPSAVREQNVDGSDYTEPAPPPRAARSPGVGNRGASADQRDVTVDGENLQDLSAVSSAELSFPRDAEAAADRHTDLSEPEPPPPASRRHSLSRVHTSCEDSERDQLFKASPRRDRDRDKHASKSTRERERDTRLPRDRDDKKKSRDSERRRQDKDRKERDRDERREREASGDERRSKRETSGDERRSKRAARRRYDTEDTDYYSDKERERRSYRESSYTSKPPRPSDKDKRYRDERERDKTRRYHTIERDGRYDSRRERGERGDRGDRRPRYRDIDPAARHAPRDKREYSPSRPHSRDATDEDTDRRERRRHARHDAYNYDPYAAEAYSDPYSLQRRQYAYYEQLRRRDPAAYMQLYTRLVAGEHPPLPPGWEGYGSLGYDSRPEERVSVNSGRSSANGLTGKDTYYGSLRGLRRAGGDSPRAPSLRTDLSDRDFNTDASLNLHLDESTVRSERMTPFKFSTAHVKADVSSGNVVVVRPTYPVDGAPATVHILSLATALQHDPASQELRATPGPLARGVTHKKSVVEYCLGRAAGAARRGGDVIGHALVWQFLAMLLTQNGMVVGSDIAELLMKNIREYELKPAARAANHNGSRRASSSVSESRSHGSRSRDTSPQPPQQPPPPPSDDANAPPPPAPAPAPDPRALDRYRELLIFGDKQQALEWAMSNNLWGHALYLSSYCERRSRAAAAARFVAHLPAGDPLRTLYAAAAHPAGARPCISEGAEWRSHVAILLANGTGRPEEDQVTLVKIGDSLAARGLTQSAQFVYLAAGLAPARHPLAPLPPAAAAAAAPPRLALLLAEPRRTELRRFATNEAIVATEVYEYAMSLNAPDFVVPELQVYKLVLATRLLDCGLHARALAYTERAARALTRDPHAYSPRLLHQVAELADRLKYHEPLLAEDPPLMEDGDSAPASPRHQWIDDVRHAAALTAQGSQHSTPQHAYYQQQQTQQHEQPQQQPLQQQMLQQQSQQYSWPQEQQPPQPGFALPPPPGPPPPAATPPAPDHDYSYYQHDSAAQGQQESSQYQPQPQYAAEASAGHAGEWGARPPQDAWPDQYGYHEDAAPPQITMPGAPPPTKPALYADFEDDRAEDTDKPASSQAQPSKKEESKPKDDGKSGKTGWLGGILTKLSLRAPNQMILPDDKNPSIVWDPERKRWRNTDGAEEEAAHAPPPPPPNPHHAAGAAPVMTPTAGMPPPLQPPSNMYKLQKSRHIKKSYVDVFNPSGAPPSRAPPAAADVLPPPPPAAPPAYYVPPAPSDTGRYLDPIPSNEESNWG